MLEMTNLWIKSQFCVWMVSIGLCLEAVHYSSTTTNRNLVLDPQTLSSTLDSQAGFLIAWSIIKEENNSGTLKLSIFIKPKYHWVGIGFADETDPDLADWFIGWHSRNDNIYYKDCNTMHDDSALHIDTTQNYYVIQDADSPKSLNVTFERKLYTGDSDDIEIMRRPGDISMVFAFGHANTFAKIRSDLPLNRRDLTLSLIPTKHAPVKNEKASAGTLPDDGGSDEDVSAQVVKDAGMAESGNNQIPTKKASDHTLRIKAKQPLHAQLPRQFSTQLPRQHPRQLSTQLPKELPRELPKQSNSTVIVEEITESDSHWYEIFKFKENSAYYAIIGSSAILTGMIVFIIACCCFKRKRPRVSKVAFYKVDDYDEENVEFLKERT